MKPMETRKFGWKFLSTLSLRRATLGVLLQDEPQAGISIHALLAESDDPS